MTSLRAQTAGLRLGSSSTRDECDLLVACTGTCRCPRQTRCSRLDPALCSSSSSTSMSPACFLPPRFPLFAWAQPCPSTASSQ
eukprot:748152-Hanusia_phi.AAC.2